MVHVTDVKSTTLMEQVADDYEQLGKQGRPVKQEEDPTETTKTPEVKGSPSSHLRSKTKQQTTSIQQGQLEHNPSTVTHWNAIQVRQRSMKCKLPQKFIL